MIKQTLSVFGGVLLISVSAFAQAKPERVWIDVNAGVAASSGGVQTYAFADRLFSETRAFATAYPKPTRGGEFDFGGGYMFTPFIGIGLNATGTAHKDSVGLGVSVPHPFFFNSATTADNTTDTLLTRGEGSANIQLMLAPINTGRLRVRFFAGPSRFQYKADMVQDIEYSQVAFAFSRANAVAITGYSPQEVTASGWGFHAGGDVSVFFSRFVGVGGFVRFNKGTVTIDEPMSELSQDVKVGGLQTGGGLRLRF